MDGAGTAASDREARPPARRRWRRLALAGFLVTVAVLAVRALAFDVRRVREQSMAPGLVGGRDWILVRPVGFETPAPGRFELWLFREERAGTVDDPDGEGEAPLVRDSVKRVLALEGEWIDFRAGDLFVGKERSALERARRPAAVVDAMLLPVASAREGEPFLARLVTTGGGARCEEGSLVFAPDGDATLEVRLGAAFGQGEAGVFDDHPGAGGSVAAGRHLVPDVRIDCTVEHLAPNARLEIVHALHREHRALVLDGDRLEVVVVEPDGVARTLARVDGLALPAALRMETIDGVFRVAQRHEDGGSTLLFEGERDTVGFAAYLPEAQAYRSVSEVRIEVAGGPARLAALDIARDVYYFWPPGLRDAQLVENGHFFLVGDNVPASRDSRSFGAVPIGSLIGRATRILWPNGREIP